MITYNEIPAVLEQIQQDLQRVLSLLDNQKEKSKDEETLLTRQDVKSLFKIHISTLYNWVKSKRLQQISFGGRVYFRRKDIMDLLNK
jgi:two-component sensor histidine kinase